MVLIFFYDWEALDFSFEISVVLPPTPLLFCLPHAHPPMAEHSPLIFISATAGFKRASLLWINVALIWPPTHGDKAVWETERVRSEDTRLAIRHWARSGDCNVVCCLTSWFQLLVPPFLSNPNWRQATACQEGKELSIVSLILLMSAYYGASSGTKKAQTHVDMFLNQPASPRKRPHRFAYTNSLIADN